MIISAVIAHFVAVISPGPDTAIILREVSKNGFASGFLCSIGIGLGVTIHSILAVYGISLILFSISTLSIIISMIGGSYLLYLGFLSLRFPDPNLTANQLELGSFLNGLITNLFNIKAFIFFISLFSIINETLTNNMKIFLPLYFGFASFLWFLILSKIITTNYLSKFWMGNIVVINKLIGLILVTISLLIFLNIFI